MTRINPESNQYIQKDANLNIEETPDKGVKVLKGLIQLA